MSRASGWFYGTGELDLEAAILTSRGALYSDIGEPQLASDQYRRALDLREKTGDQKGQAGTLNNLAVLHRGLGELQEALGYYSRTLEILRQTEDRLWQARTLNNIGFVYQSLGEQERALSYLGESLRLRREIADRRGEAVTLNNLGLVYRSLGEYTQAEDAHLRALGLCRAAASSSRSLEASTVILLARSQMAAGEVGRALETFDQALEIVREAGYRAREADVFAPIRPKHSFSMGPL